MGGEILSPQLICRHGFDGAGAELVPHWMASLEGVAFVRCEPAPAEADPPIELNRAEMEKYRPEMRKFYLDKVPRFD